MSELIDNRAHRIRTLKDIIKHLHAGMAPQEVKSQLARLVGETDHSEIVAMEQELLAEGMAVEEIQSLCDLHSQVTRDVLVQLPPRAVPAGHPVDTFRRENEALRSALRKMREAMDAIRSSQEDSASKEHLLRWQAALNELMDIDKHYQRKEHAFFSCLERHGIYGPPKVMWGKDDEVRQLLKELGTALRQEATTPEWSLLAASVGETTVQSIEEMIYKEENILLPMCLDVFTDEDWGQIWSVSAQYGWCLVEPRHGYEPPAAVMSEVQRVESNQSLQMATGSLTLEQLTGIFSALPVDLTFVDAEDRVGFFSEGPHRIFARSKAIVGRKVQHCHPPRSVDVVDHIITDFREGRQSVAEFWINFHNRFVHIRYFAVRDARGTYLGTLEVTQDLTEARQLTGERRLLEYSLTPAGGGT